MKKILVIALLALCMNAIAQNNYDTVSFEKPSTEIVIKNTSNSLWQIGKPQKTLFDSAYSGKRAILTDTISDYPPNDTSSFIYIIRNPYTQTCETCMQFWHKYDMDTTGDKGIIDASYDGGKSWLLLKDTSNTSFGYMGPSYINWEYDYHKSNGTYTSHKLITSGSSGGWIQPYICWQWFIPVKKDTIITNPDSLMIRFTFVSDATTKNKEGWMIDEIVTSSAPWQDCTGIKVNTLADNISVYPNPAFSVIQVTGNQLTVIGIEIYDMLGEKVYQSLVNGHSLSGVSPMTNALMTNAPMTINVSSFPSGMYFAEIRTAKGSTMKKFIKE